MARAHEYYLPLLEAFRVDPHNLEQAAKKAGTTWKTARRAFEKGIPSAGYPPISQVLREEQEKARAMLEAERLAKAAERQRELEAASAQAVQARKQEGQITGLVRQQSLAALTAVSVFAAEARKLAEVIRENVELERVKLAEWTAYEARVVAGDPNATPPAWHNGKNKKSVRTLENLLGILHRTADYAQKITACARQAMEMERLHLGEPIGIIRHEVQARDITLEELRTRKENALRVIERAEQAGGLKVIPGGKTDPVVGQRVVVR